MKTSPPPFPTIESVHSVLCAPGYAALICPDPNAGRRGRYSVFMVGRNGAYDCVGRELPLRDARRIAATWIKAVGVSVFGEG